MCFARSGALLGTLGVTRLALLVVGVALCCAIAGVAGADVVPPDENRGQITVGALMDGDDVPEKPIHNAWFMPVGESSPAVHALSGTLAIPETRMLGFDGNDIVDGWFPQVEVSFVTHQDHLIPVEAGLIPGTGEFSPWNLIVSPGRVWSEVSDGGMSRASFPFVLAGGAWWNEAHNGLATFVFDDEMVSDVQFQIVQETAPDNEFVAFGQLSVTYTPHTFGTEQDIIAAFERDRGSRLPVRPFADLEDGLSLSALRTVAGRRSDEPVSASGMVIDNVTRISQVSSIFSAARRRFCYKNHEVVAYMERRIWHTRWVNRNRGAFGSFLTVD